MLKKYTLLYDNTDFTIFILLNIFLNLIKVHFTSNNKLSKTFNKNAVKVYYSCLPSKKDVMINSQSKKTKKEKNNLLKLQLKQA